MHWITTYKAVVNFGDEDEIKEDIEETTNQLRRTKQIRVYHSSSDEDEEEFKPRPKVWIKKYETFFSTLSKNFSFENFWCSRSGLMVSASIFFEALLVKKARI